MRVWSSALEAALVGEEVGCRLCLKVEKEVIVCMTGGCCCLWNLLEAVIMIPVARGCALQSRRLPSEHGLENYDGRQA